LNALLRAPAATRCRALRHCRRRCAGVLYERERVSEALAAAVASMKLPQEVAALDPSIAGAHASASLASLPVVVVVCVCDGTGGCPCLAPSWACPCMSPCACCVCV
jgi:hypothetical protein